MEETRQNTPDFIVNKKVDESWKNTVEKEKSSAAAPVSAPAPDPAGAEEEPQTPEPGKPDFLYFLSGLGMQALAALGELPDESGISTPADLGHAKYLIDVLDMLVIKTKGNLSAEEKKTLEQLLYQLRVKFVQKSRELP